MNGFFKSWITSIVRSVRDKYFLTWFIPLLTIALVLTAILMGMLGYDNTFQIAHLYSENCRKLSDLEALCMLLAIFVSGLSCILAIGELIIFADNRRHGRVISYLSFITTVCAAVISLTLTFLLSHAWCR